MRKISTGEDATLGNYKKIAKVFGPEAEKFIQDKINTDAKGENAEVIADESQVLMLFASMMEK